MVQLRRTGPQIGVEVSGIDLRTLDDAGFARIYRAWLDNNVMVVTGQDLTIDEFLRYSRRFGPVSPHPSKSTRHPERPEITLLGVGKFRPDGTLNQAIYRRGAEGWHTDGAYDDAPFKAKQLYGLAVPDTGGDTLFASGYAAHRAMPGRLKQRLGGVLGAFTYGGRKQSQALMIQPDAEYRHTWRVGDVVIWDNRCSYHKAAGDYPPEQDRIHWRTSIKDWPEEAGARH